MSTPYLPWKISSAIRFILGEEFQIQYYERLESKRNLVYKISGSSQQQEISSIYIAKCYQQSGIANEISVLQEAYQKKLLVPQIIGTTADVLITEYIEGHNLCDLITQKPYLKYAKSLAVWLAKYHAAFQRANGQVLVKGDSRIRNFIMSNSQLFGVDFEESQYDDYHKDIAQACGSILDTDPLFTPKKLKLCQTLIHSYAKTRRIKSKKRLNKRIQKYLVPFLWETAKRRDDPPDLIKYITQFEEGTLRI